MIKIDPFLYSTIYYSFVSLLCISYALKLRLSDTPVYINRNSNNNIELLFIALIVVCLGIWLGMRDVESSAFVDTVLYAQLYDYSVSPENLYRHDSDFGWGYLMYFFKSRGFSANFFFTVVALTYYTFNTIAIKKVFQNNIWGPFIIFLISFSTYAFCINGIRNGLATSFVILGISFISSFKKTDFIIGLLLMTLGFTIHKTIILPSVCVLTALFINNFKICYIIWIFSILISFLFGNFFASIFASLGFDDRMTTYLDKGVEYAKMGYKVGFRWDFLIYSAAPIILGYISVIKRGIYDRKYLILLNTYVLANSFWVLVIRAAYSNRFAYLSWFLYPIVLAYPLFKFKLWENQNQKVAIILIGYVILNVLI